MTAMCETTAPQVVFTYVRAFPLRSSIPVNLPSVWSRVWKIFKLDLCLTLEELRKWNWRKCREFEDSLFHIYSQQRRKINLALEREYTTGFSIRCNKCEGRESRQERYPVLTVTFLRQAQWSLNMYVNAQVVLCNAGVEEFLCSKEGEPTKKVFPSNTC